MDRLGQILRERLRLEDIAALARIAERTASGLGLSEEPPGDEAATRILEPAFYDAFAVSVLNSDLSEEEKLRVADLAFDLVQLPRTEHEAFAAQQAIPAHLPRFGAFLTARERATAQHLLEMIYALFHRALEPERLGDATPRDLARLARVAEATDTQRILYGLLVVTYPGAAEDVALARFRALVDQEGLPEVAREQFSRALCDREAFQRALPLLVDLNDLGFVDFTMWAFSLPGSLEKAAAAWAPL